MHIYKCDEIYKPNDDFINHNSEFSRPNDDFV